MITVRGAIVPVVHYAERWNAPETLCGRTMVLMSRAPDPVATCVRCLAEAARQAD